MLFQALVAEDIAVELDNLLTSGALVEVSLGGKRIEPENVEAGTGFYEEKLPAAEVKPKLSQITVKKVDQGVAWGSVHWQYFEDISKVTPHEGTPLKLKKSLYTKVNTTRGPVLEPVKGALKVGDYVEVAFVVPHDGLYQAGPGGLRRLGGGEEIV